MKLSKDFEWGLLIDGLLLLFLSGVSFFAGDFWFGLSLVAAAGSLVLYIIETRSVKDAKDAHRSLKRLYITVSLLLVLSLLKFYVGEFWFGVALLGLSGSIFMRIARKPDKRM